jgi:hypothetical protein
MLNTSWTSIFLIIINVVFVILPCPGFARTKQFQWTARITASQEYDSNINLDKENEEDDWITRVGPGLSLAILTEEAEVKLDYDMAFTYYARNQDNNIVRHDLTLSGIDNFPVSERMTLDLNNAFHVSEEPVEVSKEVNSTRRTRDRYYRNTFRGRLNYLFGPQNSFYVGFNHDLLINDDRDLEDSNRYGPTAGIAYWPSIRHGLNFDLVYSWGHFEESADYEQYRGDIAYIYQYSPRTQANLRYAYDSLNYDADSLEERVDVIEGTVVGRDDYVVHSASVGLSHEFTPNLSTSLSGGYYYQDNERRDDNEGFIGDGSITQAFPNGFFSLNASGGYTQQYIEAQNIGFSEYFLVGASVSYQFTEKFSGVLSGSYRRDDYKEALLTNRIDEKWNGGIDLTYTPFSWLSASLGYDYREEDSSYAADNYTRHLVMFRLVGTYRSPPKSF